MNESVGAWSEIVSILPIIITVVPYLIWAIAFRSAYVSMSGNRALWLMVLGVSFFIFPIFGAIAYFAFRNSPTLANLPKGRIIGEFMNSAQQAQNRNTGNPADSEVKVDVTINDVIEIKTPTAQADLNDFSSHVPPLPERPSDKYEVLK